MFEDILEIDQGGSFDVNLPAPAKLKIMGKFHKDTDARIFARKWIWVVVLM